MDILIAAHVVVLLTGVCAGFAIRRLYNLSRELQVGQKKISIALALIVVLPSLIYIIGFLLCGFFLLSGLGIAGTASGFYLGSVSSPTSKSLDS